jgi:hypothetical protein
MRVVIAGGHGKIALLLERLLAKRGDQAVGLIRNPKTAAEADLCARDLDWTIVRPGGLTDAPATGKVRLAAPPVPGGRVPAPTSLRSLLPCSTNRVPGTRRLSWPAETARSPRPCTAFPDHGAGTAPLTSPQSALRMTYRAGGVLRIADQHPASVPAVQRACTSCGGISPQRCGGSRCLLLREPPQGTSSPVAGPGHFIVADATRPHERWEAT